MSIARHAKPLCKCSLLRKDLIGCEGVWRSFLQKGPPHWPAAASRTLPLQPSGSKSLFDLTYAVYKKASGKVHVFEYQAKGGTYYTAQGTEIVTECICQATLWPAKLEGRVECSVRTWARVPWIKWKSCTQVKTSSRCSVSILRGTWLHRPEDQGLPATKALGLGPPMTMFGPEPGATASPTRAQERRRTTN